MKGPGLFKPGHSPGSFLYVPIRSLHPTLNTLMWLPTLPGQQALASRPWPSGFYFSNLNLHQGSLASQDCH